MYSSLIQTIIDSFLMEFVALSPHVTKRRDDALNSSSFKLAEDYNALHNSPALRVLALDGSVRCEMPT